MKWNLRLRSCWLDNWNSRICIWWTRSGSRLMSSIIKSLCSESKGTTHWRYRKPPPGSFRQGMMRQRNWDKSLRPLKGRKLSSLVSLYKRISIRGTQFTKIFRLTMSKGRVNLQKSTTFWPRWLIRTKLKLSTSSSLNQKTARFKILLTRKRWCCLSSIGLWKHKISWNSSWPQSVRETTSGSKTNTWLTMLPAYSALQILDVNLTWGLRWRITQRGSQLKLMRSINPS